MFGLTVRELGETGSPAQSPAAGRPEGMEGSQVSNIREFCPCFGWTTLVEETNDLSSVHGHLRKIPSTSAGSTLRILPDR